MTILEFLLVSLACWRISSLFAKEAGPFHVFENIRKRAGIQHDIDGNVQVIPHRFFAELLSCVWCTSIWIAFFFWGLWVLNGAVCVLVALPFALSAAAILINHFVV